MKSTTPKSIEEKGRNEAERLPDEATRRRQLRILDLFGTVDFDPAYDYKAERRRKRGQP